MHLSLGLLALGPGCGCGRGLLAFGLASSGWPLLASGFAASMLCLLASFLDSMVILFWSFFAFFLAGFVFVDEEDLLLRFVPRPLGASSSESPPSPPLQGSAPIGFFLGRGVRLPTLHDWTLSPGYSVISSPGPLPWSWPRQAARSREAHPCCHGRIAASPRGRRAGPLPSWSRLWLAATAQMP